MRQVGTLLLTVLLTTAADAVAGRTLPILPGRYAVDSCAGPSASTTRYFKAGMTSTASGTCTVAVKSVDGSLYYTHLTCLYQQASGEQDDVTFKVESPTAVTWINECSAVTYHFCGR